MAALSAYKNRIPAVVEHTDKRAVDSGLDKVVLAETAEAVGLAAPYTVSATPEELSAWHGPRGGSVGEEAGVNAVGAGLALGPVSTALHHHGTVPGREFLRGS